jgi:urate oxidase
MILPHARTWAVHGIPIFQVTRTGDRHGVHDLVVDAQLELGAAADVDSVQLARVVREQALRHAGLEPEQCALTVARSLRAQTGADAAVVDVHARGWSRLDIGGREQGHELARPALERRLARARVTAQAAHVAAGIRDLQLLATSEPGGGALQRRLEAVWTYGWLEIPFQTQYTQVHRVLTDAYVERRTDESARLTETLARAVLDESPAVRRIEIALAVLDRAAAAGGAWATHGLTLDREEAD